MLYGSESFNMCGYALRMQKHPPSSKAHSVQVTVASYLSVLLHVEPKWGRHTNLKVTGYPQVPEIIINRM